MGTTQNLRTQWRSRGFREGCAELGGIAVSTLGAMAGGLLHKGATWVPWPKVLKVYDLGFGV